MIYTILYIVSNINIKIESQDHFLYKKVTNFINDHFHFKKSQSSSLSNYIYLRFNHRNLSFVPSNTSKKAVVIFNGSGILVSKYLDTCYIQTKSSFAKLELKKGLATIDIKSSFWKSNLKTRIDFFLLVLLWLFREKELYALHSNCLIGKDGNGVLVLGPSGSGKSTCSLNLINQGWSYLSDDITLIRNSENGIEAFSFLKLYSISSILYDKYFGSLLIKQNSSNARKKEFIDLKSIYPDKFKFSCFPNILLFPKVTNSIRSDIIPLDVTQTFIRLIENSAGIMIERDRTIKQIQVLKKLLKQTVGFDIHLGQDLYIEPDKTINLISNVI